MNKRFSITKLMLVLTFLFTLLVTVGCKQNPALSFEKDTIETEVGEIFKLAPQVTNLSGEDLVEYTFDQEGIVSLEKTNTFRALKEGTVKITATLKDHKDIFFTITVKVSERKADEIDLSGLTRVAVGKTTQLNAQILPSSTANKEVKWSSEKEEIATVDENGLVTGVKVGETTIKCESVGNPSVNKTIIITVFAEVTEIKVTGEKEMKVGEEQTLTTEVLPENAENKAISFASSDAEIATISKAGVVKALKAGTVTITVKAKDAGEASTTFEIKVSDNAPKPERIEVKYEKDMTVGDSQKLGITVTPEGASQEVTFESSDAEIATIDEKGEITAIAEGTVRITVKSKELDTVLTTIEITITEYVEKIESLFISADGTYYAGSSYDVDYIVEPETATAFIFKTSDEKIATIDEFGRFKCLTSGKVKLSIESTDGTNLKEEVEIQIIDRVNEIKVTGKNRMEVKTEQALYVELLPRTSQAYPLYESSDENILTVTSQGRVTAVNIGTAKIIVKSSDGSEVTKEFEIEVTEPLVDAKYALVDPKVASMEKASKYEYAGIEFIVGYTAFSTLEEAFKVATERVYIASGTYEENVTISKSGLTVYGPNAGINPNKQSRGEEAVIKGQITVAAGTSNVVINGLAFTEGSKVRVEQSTDNIELSYNNIYDTNDGGAWVEGRTQVEAVFDLWSPLNDGTESSNLKVINNRFNNIKKTGVLFARNNNVTVTGNEFINFTNDAIRAEGGYNYGTWLFDGNTFKNDQLQAMNGIYFQSVSGILEGAYQQIVITNNKFENIGTEGAESSYNCAISIRTYQEKGLGINILYNTFKNCVNYMNLRNNGANAETFEAHINYNKFVGVPSGVYHRNCRPGSGDSEASNPFLANMDNNYFEDLEGNPIVDLTPYKDKFVDLASYKDNFATKAEYEAKLKEVLNIAFSIVVNSEWAGLEKDTVVEALGFHWIIGTNAFSTISDAIGTLDSATTIKVLPGTYEDELNITINGIILLGNNEGVNARDYQRDTESVINAAIKVAAEGSGFTLDGFELQGSGQVLLTGSCENVTVQYNVANGTKGDGLIRVEGTDSVPVNTKFIGNYSAKYTAARVIHMVRGLGLEAIDNYFNAAPSTYDFLNSSGGYIGGKVIIKDNTFNTSYQSFLYVTNIKSIDALIEGNIVENVGQTIVDFRTMTEENGTAKFVIRNNTFKNSGCEWCPIRIRTAGYTDGCSIEITVNDNKFIESGTKDDATGGYYFIENPSFSSQKDPFKTIYEVGKNYYEMNGKTITELTNDNFSGAAKSFEAPYASIDEMPEYKKGE